MIWVTTVLYVWLAYVLARLWWLERGVLCEKKYDRYTWLTLLSFVLVVASTIALVFTLAERSAT